jgi:hypothetical protein
MVTGFESLFPGLKGKNYQMTSSASDVYNCPIGVGVMLAL